jgi:hypothetical protein
MPTSRRSTGISKRVTRGCNRGTHSSSSGWRRRNGRSPDDVRLIRSMLAIIPKFHLSLDVDDYLNVGCINNILSSMVKHMHHLYLEEGTRAWRRLVIKYS